MINNPPKILINQTISITGAQNNYNPGLFPVTTLEWNGAADTTISGIAGGVTGFIFTFKNISIKTAFFLHNSVLSNLNNVLLNAITSGATPVGPGGFISYAYDGTNWKLINHCQGQTLLWTPTIGGTGGQSGQIYSLQEGYYQVIGTSVSIQFSVVLSTLGTITGNVVIQGLPYAGFNGTTFRTQAILAWQGFTTAVFTAQGRLKPNASVLEVLANTAAVTSITTLLLVQADLSNTAGFTGGLVYPTN